jgi:hypothetical protein
MREIGGLKTRIALLNNYDLKEANNKATRPSKKNSDPNRLYYYVNELGATFWSTGPPDRQMVAFLPQANSELFFVARSILFSPQSLGIFPRVSALLHVICFVKIVQLS